MIRSWISTTFNYYLTRRRKNELEDWNIKVLNQCVTSYIPFKIKRKLPKTDHGKRGYSDKYVENLRKELNVVSKGGEN